MSHSTGTTRLTLHAPQSLKGDLMGGLTAAIVALPLALAFAVASGVDPKAGLYAAIVAGIIASLFGGSPVQITGPTGAMAVILVALVSQYGLEKIWIAGILAGLMQIALGFLKMGKLITYFPYPVIIGFTNGIAVIIFSGQLGAFLGVKADAGHGFLPMMQGLFGMLPQVNVAAMGIGALVIATMLIWPRINATLPGSLVGLVVATAAASLLGLDVPRIGSIPQSLPLPQLPEFDLAILKDLIKPAIALAALGSIESLLSAVVADGMTGQKHKPNQELIGQGLANVAVPFFGGIPVTGAIARTAVNIRSGGRTRLSGVIHGVALAVIVLAFAPLAAQIPLAALAGILMVTSFRMLEWHQVKLMANSTKSDLFVLLLTWGVTIFFDLILAVEVGLIAAAALFLRRMSDLHLIKMPSEKILPPGDPTLIPPDMAVYQIAGPLFFGAATEFADTLKEQRQIRVLLLRMRAVPNIDATAAVSLEEIVDTLNARGIRVVLSGLDPQVSSVLERMGVLAKVGRENVFETSLDAIHAISPPPPETMPQPAS
ncbi:C4-dicarboxylic acid transporter DauA [compost metagenome]